MTDPLGLLDLFLLAAPLERLFTLIFRQHVDLQLQQLHLLLQLVLELLQLLLLRITTTVSRDQQNENKNILSHFNMWAISIMLSMSQVKNAMHICTVHRVRVAPVVGLPDLVLWVARGGAVTDLVLFELLVGGLHVDALCNLRFLDRRLLLLVQLLDVRLVVPQQRLHAQVAQVSVLRSSACTRKYRKYQYPAAASALVSVRQRVLLSRYKNN